jgi:hypothetical protein
MPGHTERLSRRDVARCVVDEQGLAGFGAEPAKPQLEDAATWLGHAGFAGQHDLVGQAGHAIGGQPGPGVRLGVRHDGRPHLAAKLGNTAEKPLVPTPPHRDVSAQPA